MNTHQLPAINPAMSVKGRLTAGIVVVAIAVASLVVVGHATSGPATTPAFPQPTSQQLSRFQAAMTTDKGRSEFVKVMKESFGQVAKIGFGPLPAAGSSTIDLDAAWGINWDHVWIIASFADVSDGVLAAAVARCVALAPGYWKWACGAAGWAIDHLANLRPWEAWSSSHGVWAAWYWFPWSYWTGGYW